MRNFNFSVALELLKQNKEVARINAHNKIISLIQGNYSTDISNGSKLDYIDENLFQRGDFNTITRTPHFRCNCNGVTTEGWIPNPEDMLSDDWFECR
jgi:hypothetical protein